MYAGLAALVILIVIAMIAFIDTNSKGRFWTFYCAILVVFIAGFYMYNGIEWKERESMLEEVRDKWASKTEAER